MTGASSRLNRNVQAATPAGELVGGVVRGVAGPRPATVGYWFLGAIIPIVGFVLLVRGLLQKPLLIVATNERIRVFQTSRIRRKLPIRLVSDYPRGTELKLTASKEWHSVRVKSLEIWVKQEHSRVVRSINERSDESSVAQSHDPASLPTHVPPPSAYLVTNRRTLICSYVAIAVLIAGAVAVFLPRALEAAGPGSALEVAFAASPSCNTFTSKLYATSVDGETVLILDSRASEIAGHDVYPSGTEQFDTLMMAGPVRTICTWYNRTEYECPDGVVDPAAQRAKVKVFDATRGNSLGLELDGFSLISSAGCDDQDRSRSNGLSPSEYRDMFNRALAIK